MKIITIEQGTQEWLDFRKGKITGTKTSACLPTKRMMTDGSFLKKEWWALVAERLTSEDENGVSTNPMQRGHDLEKDCAEITVVKYKLQNPKYDCGIWQSDNERLILSPDCHEDSDKPAWAIECKALNSADHIKTIYRDLEYSFEERPDERFTATNYDICATAIDRIPQEYREQALDYFIVNQDLKTLYFSLYDPHFENPRLCHWVFEIKREDIEHEINGLAEVQKLSLKEIDAILDILSKHV